MTTTFYNRSKYRTVLRTVTLKSEQLPRYLKYIKFSLEVKRMIHA